MKTIKNFSIVILLPFVFLFTSCLNNEITEANEEILFAEIGKEINSTTISDEVISNVEKLVNEFVLESASKVGGQQRVAAAEFPITTLISGNFKKNKLIPEVYEINYGDEYYDEKKNLYKGVIIYTRNSYASSVHEFKDFYVNINQLIDGKRDADFYEIKGSRKADYDTANVKEGTPAVLTIEKDITMTNLETKKSTKRYKLTKRTLLDDNNTPDVYTDDSFSFEGNSKGTTLLKGKLHKYSYEILKPLETVSDWKYYVRGVTSTIIGKDTQIIDYGDGEKDQIAIRTINDVSKKIELNWGDNKKSLEYLYN